MYTRETSGQSYYTDTQILRRENRRLHLANEQLRRENNLLNQLVENVKVGIFVKNQDNIFTFVNTAFCEHLNISKELLLFKERPRIPKAIRKYISDDKEVIKSKSMTFNLVESKDPHGNVQWIETVKFPHLDESQMISGIYGFTYDVTDAVAAQSGLQETRIDLLKAQRLNEALRQFSYAASHDLQEPLRSVHGFLSIIKMEYGDKLDEQAMMYMDKAGESLQRMQQLIKDILDYAVINGAKYDLVPVDLNKVVSDVLLNLDQAIRDHEAIVEVGELPEVLGSQGLLVHYFQNMLSNALKYKSTLRKPKIKIFSEVHPKHYLIGISDNGMGIDPAYFVEIFKPFKRLHRQSDIKGSGIGLATSKKIVEIHGGKIWVESETGSGSTFFMELPKK